jgi:hypothetical protein
MKEAGHVIRCVPRNGVVLCGCCQRRWKCLTDATCTASQAKQRASRPTGLSSLTRPGRVTHKRARSELSLNLRAASRGLTDACQDLLRRFRISTLRLASPGGGANGGLPMNVTGLDAKTGRQVKTRATSPPA